MNTIKHTPGPWRWELNEKHQSLQLVGGRPQYDLTVIQPVRWGMGNATLFVRDTMPDGHNLLYRLHERRDWVAPLPGREHHASWCAGVTHPDLLLIAAAPELLALVEELIDIEGPQPGTSAWADKARAIVAKVKGGAA